MRVIFKNGSSLIFRNLDNPGRLSSLELNWFAMDEIGEVKEETFKMLQGRVRRRVGGRLCGFGVGNPAGPAHWTYDTFVTKAALAADQFRLISAPTTENYFLPKAYVERMRRSYGEDTAYYKSYVLGQFCAFEGAYWSAFSPSPFPMGHWIEYESSIKQLFPNPGNLVWGAGADFGFENPFAVLWFVTDGQRLLILDEYCKTHGTIQQHVETMRLKEAEHYKIFPARYDSVLLTDHDAQCRAEIAAVKNEHGQPIGYQCVPANKRVMEGVLLVQALFGDNRIFITDRCVQARREIASYRAKTKSASATEDTKDEPLKKDDHTCDVLRYICMQHMRHLAPWIRDDNPVNSLYRTSKEFAEHAATAEFGSADIFTANNSNRL
jgi:PBSX family phage terminase large subunit